MVNTSHNISSLDNNNHSVFAMHYHLILVVKYRRKVFDDHMSEYAESIFRKIAPSYNITLMEWNHDIDHVHILFKAHPNTELSKFINAYKSASSRLIKKNFPEVRKKLWKEYFWSQSFCLLTTGGAPLEIIKKSFVICGYLIISKKDKIHYPIDIHPDRIVMLEGTYNCLPKELKKELIHYNTTSFREPLWSRFFVEWILLGSWDC